MYDCGQQVAAQSTSVFGVGFASPKSPSLLLVSSKTVSILFLSLFIVLILTKIGRVPRTMLQSDVFFNFREFEPKSSVVERRCFGHSTK